MKQLLSRLIIFLTLVFYNCTQIYAAPVETPEVLTKRVINSLMQQYKVPGVAVEFYVDGKPYAYNFGYANLTKKIPIKDETIFEVGSITKLLTNLLLAMEVNAGRMQLDLPLANYLTVFQTQGKAIRKISLENLSTYTAGLPFKLPESVTTPATFTKFLMDWEPAASIGSEWRYSNISTGLIGEALAAISHQSYNQLLTSKILNPLKMQPLGITVPKRYQANRAQGYGESGEPVPDDNVGLLPAAGALKVSAHDMLLFLQAAIGLSDTPKTIATAMQLTQTPYVALPHFKQGLAWEIHSVSNQTTHELLHDPAQKNLGPLPAQQLSKEEQIFDGNNLIDKTGATYGFRAYIAVLPQQKSGIVILTNRYIPNGAIVNAGRAILLNLTSQN